MDKIKILIADDSPTVVEMVKFILEKEGYETIIAFNGVEAINKVYKEIPDLILLDILMPLMNGYQVCRLLKEDKRTSYIPVIMLTGSEQKSDEFWGLATGADEFFTKDLVTSQLASTIKKILKLKAFIKNPGNIKPISKREISNEEILSRVNDLLDKKLFASTVNNEINKIANSIYDYEETVKSVLCLISRVVHCDVAALLIEELGDNNLSILLNEEISKEKVQEIINKIREDLKRVKKTNDNLSPQISIKIFNEEFYTGDGKKNKELNFFSVPLMARGVVIGIVALSRSGESSFSKDNIEVINLMADQISMVLNNVRLYTKINYLSITDGLTGLYNYRYFQDILKREFDRAEKNGMNLALIMIDIDHFKKVNDNYGHQQGDLLLKELGLQLREEIREKKDTPVRYGGEEFTFILPNTDSKAAKLVAERIRKKVSEHNFLGRDNPINITLSLGVASYPSPGIKNYTDLIAKADQSLYKAKEAGRNKVFVLE